MITANIGLYDNANNIVLADNTEILERIVLSFSPEIGDSWAVVRSGDTLDRIAAAAYKGFVSRPELLWGVIADANNIENPLFLDELVGRFLLVPEFYRALAALEGDNQNDSELAQNVSSDVSDVSVLVVPPTVPTPTNPIGGGTNTLPPTPTTPMFLVLKNVGGGYSLVTGDSDGAMQLTPYININDYPNAMIFETLQIETNVPK